MVEATTTEDFRIWEQQFRDTEQLVASSSPEHKLPVDERSLTEVDHLLKHRHADGTYDDFVLESVLTNLRSAVQEAAMPYAVSSTQHELVHNPETNQPTLMWLGKTAVAAAMSGYNFHYHPEAIKRVDVEVHEARTANEDLRLGVAKVFISPRMTRVDATLEEARAEHLGDDDAVRVSWLEADANNNPTHREMQSLLVRDIPLQAWVAMLRDEHNIFGRSVPVEDNGSALPVMQAHEYLELPVEAVPNGPVDIIRAVAPYITDPTVRHNVEQQLIQFGKGQEDMAYEANLKAKEWFTFEYEMAESLRTGQATQAARRFIIGLQEHWTPEELEIIQAHSLDNAEYTMTRQLASVLEQAKRNTLWSTAAITIGNEEVMAQIEPGVMDQLQFIQNQITFAQAHNREYKSLEMQREQLLAGQQIKVGAGCVGESDRSRAGIPGVEGEAAEGSDESDRTKWKWKQGTCRVVVCRRRGEVGPCEVCRTCQAKFDRGEDPTKPELGQKAEQKSQEAHQDKTSDIDQELQSIIEAEPVPAPQSRTNLMQTR